MTVLSSGEAASRPASAFSPRVFLPAMILLARNGNSEPLPVPDLPQHYVVLAYRFRAGLTLPSETPLRLAYRSLVPSAR